MIEEKIKKIISEQFDIPVIIIRLDNKLQKDLKADALDLVEMVMAIEDEFDIDIDAFYDPNSDIHNLPDRTVGEFIEYIKDKLNGN